MTPDKFKAKFFVKNWIALAFSKMDVLEKYDVLPRDACLRDESEHLAKRAFVQSDFVNTQHEMESNKLEYIHSNQHII